jgi:hypothetical protein
MIKTKNEKSQSERLDTRRKEVLEEILNERYAISNNRYLVNFISLYIDCESIAKKYIQYYKIDNNEKKPSARKPLNYLEIEKAAKYFGLDIDSKLIVQIFKSGDANRGERTPRQLRNGIFHSKAVKDIEEVEQRFEELSKLMETWLEKSRELIHRL